MLGTLSAMLINIGMRRIKGDGKKEDRF